MPHIPASPLGHRVSQEARKIQLQEDALCRVAPLPAGGLKADDLLKGLQTGTALKLPEGRAYTIQPGDNLSLIAGKTLGPGASPTAIDNFVDKILDLNEDLIKNPHQLFAGDTIALPNPPRQGKAGNVIGFID